MTNYTKKFISAMLTVWSIMLSMIYLNAATFSIAANSVFGYVYLIVSIGWSVLAIMSIFMYSKLSKKLT